MQNTVNCIVFLKEEKARDSQNTVGHPGRSDPDSFFALISILIAGILMVTGAPISPEA